MALKKIDKVDDGLMREIVDRIVQAVNPEKIILFGSYAYGNPNQNSDLDILVLMNSKRPRGKRSVSVYRALAGLLIPKDILIYTLDEVEEWRDVSQAFITTAVRKGKVIYEKKQKRPC